MYLNPLINSLLASLHLTSKEDMQVDIQQLPVYLIINPASIDSIHHQSIEHLPIIVYFVVAHFLYDVEA